MKEVKKDDQKMNRKRMLWYIVVILLLSIGIPLLINLLYSLPVVLIRTQWGAAEVLSYYSSLLGTGVTVVTFFSTIRFTVQQMRHEQDFQRMLKMWQEMEAVIDQSLDEVHPLKLQYAFLDVITQKEAYDAVQLYGRIRSYGIGATVSVDKLFRVLTRSNDAELKKLTEQIVLVRDKLIAIADRYQQVYQQVIVKGLVSKAAPDPDGMGEQQKQFAEQIQALEKAVQDIYRNDYLNLIEQKSKLFSKKYIEISQKKPRIIE